MKVKIDYYFFNTLYKHSTFILSITPNFMIASDDFPKHFHYNLAGAHTRLWKIHYFLLRLVENES